MNQINFFVNRWKVQLENWPPAAKMKLNSRNIRFHYDDDTAAAAADRDNTEDIVVVGIDRRLLSVGQLLTIDFWSPFLLLSFVLSSCSYVMVCCSYSANKNFYYEIK